MNIFRIFIFDFHFRTGRSAKWRKSDILDNFEYQTIWHHGQFVAISIFEQVSFMSGFLSREWSWLSEKTFCINEGHHQWWFIIFTVCSSINDAMFPLDGVDYNPRPSCCCSEYLSENYSRGLLHNGLHIQIRIGRVLHRSKPWLWSTLVQLLCTLGWDGMSFGYQLIFPHKKNFF